MRFIADFKHNMWTLLLHIYWILSVTFTCIKMVSLRHESQRPWFFYLGLVPRFPPSPCRVPRTFVVSSHCSCYLHAVSRTHPHFFCEKWLTNKNFANICACVFSSTKAVINLIHNTGRNMPGPTRKIAIFIKCCNLPVELRGLVTSMALRNPLLTKTFWIRCKLATFLDHTADCHKHRTQQILLLFFE